MRLYKMEMTALPDAAKMTVAGDWDIVESRYGRIWEELADGFVVVQDPEWIPEGWGLHVAAMGWEEGDFFWPAEHKHYRSRSSAVEKKSIVERWGGQAVILEAEVSAFVPVEEANMRRKMQRDAQRAEKLRAAANRIMASHEALDDTQGRR